MIKWLKKLFCFHKWGKEKVTTIPVIVKETGERHIIFIKTFHCTKCPKTREIYFTV